MQPNKKAIVTGGNRGIGLAIAKELAAEGYDLALCALTAQSLEAVRAEIISEFPEIDVVTSVVDVSDKKALEKFASMIRQRWGTLDVLVNNAGNFLPGSVLDEADGTLETLMATNLFGAYYLTRYVFDLLEDGDGGHIFNMVSIAGIQAYPNGGSYGISKYAMLGWSKNLREECKSGNVKVNALLPGATWTDSWKASGLPESRFMQASDVASAVINALRMSRSATVEELIIRPQQGDI